MELLYPLAHLNIIFIILVDIFINVEDTILC